MLGHQFDYFGITYMGFQQKLYNSLGYEGWIMR